MQFSPYVFVSYAPATFNSKLLKLGKLPRAYRMNHTTLESEPSEAGSKKPSRSSTARTVTVKTCRIPKPIRAKSSNCHPENAPNLHFHVRG